MNKAFRCKRSITQTFKSFKGHCKSLSKTRRFIPTATSPDDEPLQIPATNSLSKTIKRKSVQVQSQLLELGQENLEERMQSSVAMPANPPYRLSTLIAELVPQGRSALLFELVRSSPSMTCDQLAALAKQYVALGADALVVRIDSEDTPEGLKDLWTVSRAVKVPVLARDYLIHPLQVVEIKESGAAGALGVIGQVNGRGTAVLSSFAAALGLDAPVEVINLLEVEGLAKAGVVFYGINISVGISIAIPGFSADLAHGILGHLPFGAISLVGVRSLEEARKAKLSGADSLLIKSEMIAQHQDSLHAMSMQLQYLVTGDD
ncbi:hypothetical protein CEUSTIGMA_g10219.t1 [Chlamydomonas eustigma]|uniref:indole-3-glycerol-phosphate synthase n=1 Tax=Chlamydomonas eustigma TaxID=1157962 RepID=A0A250XIC5_9CHLO|nr:hypothetical protein CEUSTIGMA_g10219.t1 [Chlamydomonas eustigma]|eukprot:GAX82793.1 hypothetical protein CEUSTIGMA_g10219.t1 [Chlamydomonas eustigma]